jgi:hypothetical protein
MGREDHHLCSLALSLPLLEIIYVIKENYKAQNLLPPKEQQKPKKLN